MHNNGKDALRKFDPRSDEAIFLGYFSHSKAYKVFNKRTLCVEESVHVLFDESNSLNENDAQEEDFDLGLVRKETLSLEAQGKNTLEQTDSEAAPENSRLSNSQTGGNTPEPCSGPCSLGIGSQIGAETGSKGVLEPPNTLTREEQADPFTSRPWKCPPH